VIEAGFPFASQDDFDCVRILSTESKDISICAFARGNRNDIEVAAEVLDNYSNGRIQIVTPVSDLHLETRLGKDRMQGLDLIKESINIAEDLAAEVSWIGHCKYLGGYFSRCTISAMYHSRRWRKGWKCSS
jgi:2-isopropylmalate synthase